MELLALLMCLVFIGMFGILFDTVLQVARRKAYPKPQCLRSLRADVEATAVTLDLVGTPANAGAVRRAA